MLMKDFCLTVFSFRESGADSVRVQATYVQVPEDGLANRANVEVKDEPFPADLHSLLAILRAGEVGQRIEAAGFLLQLQERIVSGGRTHLTYAGTRDFLPEVSDEEVQRLADATGVPVDAVRALGKAEVIELINRWHNVTRAGHMIVNSDVPR